MIRYEYSDAGGNHHHEYEIPAVFKLLRYRTFSDKRAFDIGCGNGCVADIFHKQGFDVTGVDPSESGIAIAKQNFPQLRLNVGSSADDLMAQYGTYPLVYSLETIALATDPHLFARRVYELLQPTGVAIISTSFHGHWKNLALSLLNQWDQHANPLWLGRYLTLFSERTFSQLWREAGFSRITIIRTGRLKPLAKTMIAVVEK